MPKRLPSTPKSRVRSALRALWLRSRERSAALKRESNTCERCGRKASRAKGKEVSVVVHHRDMIDWEEIIELIFARILCDPSRLEVLCVECHDLEHSEEKTA